MNNCLHFEYFTHHCIFFYSMKPYIMSSDGSFCYLSFAKQLIGGILCCRQQLLKFCSSFQARFLYVLFTLRMVLNLVLPVLLMAVERYVALSLASRVIIIVGMSQSFHHLSLKMWKMAFDHLTIWNAHFWWCPREIFKRVCGFCSLCLIIRDAFLR